MLTNSNLRLHQDPSLAMRFNGILKTWNDERGFGFIEPTQGGDPIFVHARAFQLSVGRPQENQAFSFEIETGVKGKRAKNVQPIRPSRAAQRSVRQVQAQWGVATLFTIPAFLIIYFVLAVLWRPPLWFAAAYVVSSTVTFLVYAIDKAAANAKSWRVSESTLHTLSLACGWPGALLAQQFLRHKTIKQSFRQVFWGTAGINVVALVLLCSPLGLNFWSAQ